MFIVLSSYSSNENVIHNGDLLCLKESLSSKLSKDEKERCLDTVQELIIFFRHRIEQEEWKYPFSGTLLHGIAILSYSIANVCLKNDIKPFDFVFFLALSMWGRFVCEKGVAQSNQKIKELYKNYYETILLKQELLLSPIEENSSSKVIVPSF